MNFNQFYDLTLEKLRQCVCKKVDKKNIQEAFCINK